MKHKDLHLIALAKCGLCKDLGLPYKCQSCGKEQGK